MVKWFFALHTILQLRKVNDYCELRQLADIPAN